MAVRRGVNMPKLAKYCVLTMLLADGVGVFLAKHKLSQPFDGPHVNAEDAMVAVADQPQIKLKDDMPLPPLVAANDDAALTDVRKMEARPAVLDLKPIQPESLDNALADSSGSPQPAAKPPVAPKIVAERSPVVPTVAIATMRSPVAAKVVPAKLRPSVASKAAVAVERAPVVPKVAVAAVHQPRQHSAASFSSAFARDISGSAQDSSAVPEVGFAKAPVASDTPQQTPQQLGFAFDETQSNVARTAGDVTVTQGQAQVAAPATAQTDHADAPPARADAPAAPAVPVSVSGTQGELPAS